MPVAPRIGTTLVAAVALVGLVPTVAHAWGAHGHRIATRVAESRLTPAARAGVKALLNPGDTLIEICTWADHEGHDVVPDSAPWHYVNVPITAPRYDARYCSDKGCVVARITHYRTVLADRQAPRVDRQLALLFLVHFVEDVHQPLHVGDNGDRGGNRTQVQFHNQGTNLHRLWDTDVINAVSRDERAWVDRISPLVTPAAVAEWSRGTVEDWATESLQAAKTAYHFPPGAARPLESGAKLGPDYEEFALPIIRKRLAQAGVRLANELNAAFP